MSETKTPELPALGFATELSEEERQQMSAFGEFTVCEAGDNVINEGEPQDSLYLVVSGTVHVQMQSGGQPILLNKLRTGDTIGEMNIFDPAQASATVTAHEFSVLWGISRNRFEEFMANHPVTGNKVLLGIATLLSKRLRKTNERVSVAQNAISQAWGTI